MDKSPEAFRTISEVAEALETPAHVLRFWESRFPQIRPVKRAGGRRYYRPSDVALLAGIKRLLHDEGMTIRGVQKILREQGIRHVAGLGGEEASPEELELGAALAGLAAEEPEADLKPEDAGDATAAALEAALAPPPAAVVVPLYPAQPESADDDLISRMIAAERAAPTPEAATAPPAHAPVAAARVESPPPGAEPSATLAARLRALPRGSLAGQQAGLARISARIAALRARLAAPAQPGPGQD